MSRRGTQKSVARSCQSCLRSISSDLEQIPSLSVPLSYRQFEGTVSLSARCEDEGKSFQQAPIHESKGTGDKLADSELLNEIRLMNAVKRSAHFSLPTSTSDEGTDSGFSGLQSHFTGGKVKGIMYSQGNVRGVMMGTARRGMWAWIFALVFFWNSHVLRAQGKFQVQHRLLVWVFF